MRLQALEIQFSLTSGQNSVASWKFFFSSSRLLSFKLFFVEPPDKKDIARSHALLDDDQRISCLVENGAAPLAISCLLHLAGRTSRDPESASERARYIKFKRTTPNSSNNIHHEVLSS